MGTRRPRRAGARPLWGAIVVFAPLVAIASCDLPNGDDDLPSTDPPGVDRVALLRVMIAPSDRVPGAVLPVAIEASLDPKRVDGGASGMCVSLAATPGSMVFPFGDGCGGADAALDGAADVAAEDAPADSGALADGGTDGAVDAGVAGPRDAATDRSAPDGAPALTVVRSCLAPSTSPDGWLAASAVAAYQPEDSEASVTIFAALYANATCSGSPVVETAEVFSLGSQEEPDAAGDAPDAADATGDAADAARDGDAPNDGPSDAPSDRAADAPSDDGPADAPNDAQTDAGG